MGCRPPRHWRCNPGPATGRETAREWGVTRGFATDLGLGEPDEEGETHPLPIGATEILRAARGGPQGGRQRQFGRLGAILAESPARRRCPGRYSCAACLAKALTERPLAAGRRALPGVGGPNEPRQRPPGGPVPVYEAGPRPDGPGARRLGRSGLDTSRRTTPRPCASSTAEGEASRRRTGAEMQPDGLSTRPSPRRKTRLGSPPGGRGCANASFATGGGGRSIADVFAKAGGATPFDGDYPDRPSTRPAARSVCFRCSGRMTRAVDPPVSRPLSG